jgi:hypothetical protein
MKQYAPSRQLNSSASEVGSALQALGLTSLGFSWGDTTV